VRGAGAAREQELLINDWMACVVGQYTAALLAASPSAASPVSSVWTE
jgi:hypothetical protein